MSKPEQYGLLLTSVVSASVEYPLPLIIVAMPIETDDQLKELLAAGRITAVTFDTNIFDAQRLNLKSRVFKAVAGLKDLPFAFLLSGAVQREVQGHLAKSMEDALRAVKKAAGEALYAFDTANPTRDELLNSISGGQLPVDAAEARLGAFLKDSHCAVLDDFSLVNTATVYGAYFDGRPPFSRGKKAEFPDALALHALDQEAANRQTEFLVVSEDGDWRAFCENSQRLYLVPKVEKALSLINDAPLGLRKAVVAWFADEQGGRAEVGSAISSLVERLDVDAIAYASSGDVETDAWDPETRSVDWPDEEDLDIIETEDRVDGCFRAVVSLPVTVTVRLLVELNFSVWDSVDKESLSMGGRLSEQDREEEVRVTATIDIHSLGDAEAEIELVDTELDLSSLSVNLGEVDIFEPEDFDYD